jgi:hypothetical protein
MQIPSSHVFTFHASSPMTQAARLVRERPDGDPARPAAVMSGVLKLLLTIAGSAMIGAGGAIWKVRGTYDDVIGRQDLQEQRTTHLQETMDHDMGHIDQRLDETDRNIRQLYRAAISAGGRDADDK